MCFLRPQWCIVSSAMMNPTACARATFYSLRALYGGIPPFLCFS